MNVPKQLNKMITPPTLEHLQKLMRSKQTSGNSVTQNHLTIKQTGTKTEPGDGNNK